MRFGERVRALRRDHGMSLRDLADKVGVTFTYVSKIENHRLDFGDYPGEDLIHKLADALDVEVEELLLLAEKIPRQIRERVLQRPSDFRRIAALDDRTLDQLMIHLDAEENKRSRTSKPK